MTRPGYCDYPPATPARRYRPAPPTPAWAAYCDLAPRLAADTELRTIPAAVAYERDLAALDTGKARIRLPQDSFGSPVMVALTDTTDADPWKSR